MLRVVIFTGSNDLIVKPLHAASFNIVGIAEENDDFGKLPFYMKWFERLYWKFIKRQEHPALSQYAKKKNVSYCEYKKADKEKFRQWLKGLSPDILVLHLVPVLDEDVFNIPKYKTVNLHPSLLPRYRGSNPYFWSYYNMDMNAGMTLHFIDKNIDTGEIIAQREMKNSPGTPWYVLSRQLVKKLGIPMLIDMLNKLEKEKTIESYPQSQSEGYPYARQLSEQEYLSLLDTGQWTLERFWHVLHSNRQWRQCFIPDFTL